MLFRLTDVEQRQYIQLGLMVTGDVATQGRRNRRRSPLPNVLLAELDDRGRDRVACSVAAALHATSQ
jgi:hypothetical protein